MSDKKELKSEKPYNFPAGFPLICVTIRRIRVGRHVGAGPKISSAAAAGFARTRRNEARR